MKKIPTFALAKRADALRLGDEPRSYLMNLHPEPSSVAARALLGLRLCFGSRPEQGHRLAPRAHTEQENGRKKLPLAGRAHYRFVEFQFPGLAIVQLIQSHRELVADIPRSLWPLVLCFDVDLTF